MARQIVMDHTGDTQHDFNLANSEEVAAAMARFHELTKEKGMTAAKRVGEGKSEVIHTFDPKAEETIFIPRLKGG